MPTEIPNMKVRTSFSPLRLVSGNKEPVVLHVEVRNMTMGPKDYSVIIRLPFQFDFGEGNMIRDKRVRIKNIASNTSKDATFRVYGSKKTQAGEYKIAYTVREHELDRFDKELYKEQNTTILRVVE